MTDLTWGGPGDRVAPARRMSPEQRREQLIRVALKLFAEQEPDEVSVDDVVRAADVSRALFYRYFSNIRDLRLAALRTVVDEVIESITPPDDLDLLGQVRHSLAGFLDSVERYAAGYVAVLRTGSTTAPDESMALVERVRTYIVSLVSTRMRKQGVIADQLAPMFELTLRSWFAIAENASVAWLAEGRIPRDRLESWLLDQLTAMLATTARHDKETALQLAAAIATEGDSSG
ncbi:MAG TPA: TetR/AcrR family transcriptional regulator [Pseudonocardia sp.]|nr:TetR/AcrR family transcriptional regulator [Pseudonocardia sp.]